MAAILTLINAGDEDSNEQPQSNALRAQLCATYFTPADVQQGSPGLAQTLISDVCDQRS